MNVLVCGGRAYPDKAFVYRALDALHRKHGITGIIQGGAGTGYGDNVKGADIFGAEWGWDHGIPVGTYNADWERYGGRAGPLRNQEMLDDGKPDCVVAFPGGRGTKDMVDRALKAGVPVWDLRDKG